MLLLAIETATDGCSVALFSDNVVTERSIRAPRGHAARVLGMVDELLKEADVSPEFIEGIVYGKGPGSFLGTRIAASVAQSLALAWSCALIPVSTLAALATQCYQASGIERVFVGWDARMQAIYWGDYTLTDGLMIAAEGDQLSSPEFFYALQVEGKIALVGNAWQTYQAGLPNNWSDTFVVYHDDLYPKASGLFPLGKAAFDKGESVPLAEGVPVYLRHPVTHQEEV